MVTQLQRGLLRLAFSFHGQNAELDAKLTQLGQLIRKGRKDDELCIQIDDAINTMVKLDCRVGATGDEGLQLSDFLAKLLANGSDNQLLRSLRERAGSVSDPSERLALLGEAVDYFGRAIEAAESGGGEAAAEVDASAPLKHLLDHWPHPVTDSERLQDTRETLARRLEMAALLSAAEDIAGLLGDSVSTQSTDPAALADSKELLFALVERLPVNDDLFSRVERVQHSIDASRTTAMLRDSVKNIGELIAEMSARLQAEIDELCDFLKLVTRRLKDLEVHIGVSRALHDDGHSDTGDLSRLVEAEFDSLREDMAGCDDVEELKKTVGSRLDAINSGLSSFVSKEESRHHEACSALEELAANIGGLEHETDQLRSELEQQHARAMVDPLTGVPNRMGFQEQLNKEYARWVRYGNNLSVAIIDIDLFKQINDSYGHAAGDKVLSRVADTLAGAIREADTLCRHGGEEFALLMPETDIDEALQTVEKLRREIADCRFHYKQTPVPVSVSCGVAQFHDQESISSAFERADEAMYLAKQRGRNRSYSEMDIRGVVA